MKPQIMSLSVLALSLASVSVPALADSSTTGAQPAVTQVAQDQVQQFIVYFGLDQATLDQTAQATVAAAAQEYQRTGQARLSVRGHTDTSGNASYNQALSERREQAVTEALISQGVPASAISGEAVGEADLAVPTGDGVVEQENRRVVIAVQQPAPPPPEPAPAPEPAPQAAAPEPEPQPEPTVKRGLLSVGPFYGYNLEDEVGGTSHLGGINISFDYAVLPFMGVGLEQAGFYHFSTDDEGLGGRSAASVNFGGGDENFAGWVGGNIGYLYGDGINDDAFAGPEIGISAGAFSAKVAYDIPFNRDLDEGIIATTIGYGFRF
jgi:outer membrane protein OmpA-like peptidoglycan-associated protein